MTVPGTVEADDVMPLVLDAMPSFRATWENEVEGLWAAEAPGEMRLHYLDAGAVARHVVSLVQAGTTGELAALLEVVEQLHVDGSAYVTELATVGYLEDLQTSARRAGIPDTTFVPLLGPVSRSAWHDLDHFWVGEDRDDRDDREDD